MRACLYALAHPQAGMASTGETWVEGSQEHYYHKYNQPGQVTSAAADRGTNTNEVCDYMNEWMNETN